MWRDEAGSGDVSLEQRIATAVLITVFLVSLTMGLVLVLVFWPGSLYVVIGFCLLFGFAWRISSWAEKHQP
jgi:hypothetical protein